MAEEHAQASSCASACCQEPNSKQQRTQRKCQQLQQLFQLLAFRLQVSLQVTHSAAGRKRKELYEIANPTEEWQERLILAISHAFQATKICVL